jgi:transposase
MLVSKGEPRRGSSMDRLAKLIEETTDVRELKRALSGKLGKEGMATEAIGAVL